MAPVADVDDTAGFMAAARALRASQEEAMMAQRAAEDASNEQGGFSEAIDTFSGIPTGDDNFVTPSAPQDAGFAAETQSQGAHSFGDFDDKPLMSDFGAEAEKSQAASVDLMGGSETASKDEALPTSGGAPSLVSSAEATAPAAASAEEEDRENATTFKTWGTPTTRDKPAAEVRKIIIKGLPFTWISASKVLSLVHGGAIESINVTPSGTAHILFCEHDACKAFYDKYPNGIDLDRERRHTVFVEMGTEVDVVSSQLAFNLSVGASRAVRAVGADMNITMGQLLKLASGSNRKVEKILDIFTPGEARSVLFRFCSIDDAVRFRGALIRDLEWEHCNIQYATDPCEFATGFHMD